MTTIKQTKVRPKLSGIERHEAFTAYLCLSPWIIGFIAFLVVPIGMAVYSAFTHWTIINPPPRWIGLANFVEMFTEDRYFYWSLWITVKYMAMTLIPGLVLALALALLLNAKLKGMNFFRTVFYVPAVVSGVAVTLLWISLLDPQMGAVNTLLRQLGVENPPAWTSSSTWALPSVAIMSLWGVGGGAIIYLSGLQNIPPHLYEAATIDGANRSQKFWRVTLPLLSPTLFFNLITGLIGAFQVFTPAYIMGGAGRWGTNKHLRFYMLHVYMKAFQEGRLGYASALAWLLTVLAAVAVTLVYRSTEQFVYYEESREGGS